LNNKVLCATLSVAQRPFGIHCGTTSDNRRALYEIHVFLPCKINIYTKDGQTFISGMRPIVLSHFFPDADLGEKPQEIDKKIQDIINNSK